MKYPFTTVHDIRDIIMIYGECKNYQMVFWNFTDQEYLHLIFKNAYDTAEPNGPMVEFWATDDHIENTVQSFDELLKQIDFGEGFDRARIRAINVANRQPMRIYFVGSSNPDKTVHWCIDYEDEDFRKWKRWFQWKKLWLSCRLDKVKKFFKSLTNYK